MFPTNCKSHYQVGEGRTEGESRFALAAARTAKQLVDMLSRAERIDGFHLKVSRTEKELYEEFLGTEEAEILAEIQHNFAQAKQKGGGIRFEQKTLWAKIEKRVDIWIASACADRHLNRELFRRAKEAILYRARDLMTKTIRESLGTR
jgi:hypothetical protein